MTSARIPNNSQYLQRHFLLHGVASTEQFRSIAGGDPRSVPPRVRSSHGNTLLRQLATVNEASGTVTMPDASVAEIDLGMQLEFVGFPSVEMAFEKLARERSGIELLNVRHERALAAARFRMTIPH